MSDISAGDLVAEAGRLGVIAGLEDEGAPAGGLCVISGTSEEWSRLGSIPGDAAPDFLEALHRIPAVTVALVRGNAVGLTASIARAVDFIVGVDVEKGDLPWSLRGSEDDVSAWLAHLRNRVSQAPLAAATTAVLLRTTLGAESADRLVAESSAYSMLRAGPEFERWLQSVAR